MEPLDNEFHGEMLTRLWVTEIRDSSDPEHIISEIDFIPVRGTLHNLSAGPLHLVVPQYVRREYPPGADPTKSGGQLKTYEQDGLPLAAPWFIYIRMTPANSGKLPPENWLAAAGKFNDAANLAVHNAVASGFVRNDDSPDWGLFQGRDAWPSVHGVHYPRLGTHTFFASSFDAPADKDLCWGLKAGDHFKNVRRLLT